MKKIHETESTSDKQHLDDDTLHSSFEDLQRIEAGGVNKRGKYKLQTLPKPIRFIGYFMIGFFIVTTVLGVILSILFLELKS